MNKFFTLLLFTILFFFYSCLVQRKGKEALRELQGRASPVSLQDSFFIADAGTTEKGDPEAGYQYLLHGNGFSGGIPYGLYKYVQWAKSSGIAVFTGQNKFVLNDFILFKDGSGKLTATPGCLHCHAQRFNNHLVIGLGNSYSDFQDDKTQPLKMAEAAIKFLYGKNSVQWKTAERVFKSGYLLAPLILTEMQGPSSAHRIAEVMASHRDPRTLIFRADTSYFYIPPIVVPIDIPPWWASRKKKAFTINAMEQGSLLKHLMSPTILTLKDTAEAREIYERIKDVWAYITTLEPPKYPYPVEQSLADKGKIIFTRNCSVCHGSYGNNQYYPNKLVPGNVIGTDSLMWKYYRQYPEYAEWFGKSWFSTTAPAAMIKPQPGYVAPPLDGIWITAPYLHNGSVPTIEAVLDSKKRPRYWKRSFNKEEYDYSNLGWKYKSLSKPGGRKSYNTDVAGYGNYGHYFGDKLSDAEREAVIEYLKTL